jgi:hypothetical protein
MNIQELIKILNAEVINLADDMEITSGYTGDFLSNVIGKAQSGCAWFTVMSNVNVAAVAHLAEVGVIVLCEDFPADVALTEKAAGQGINLIRTKHGAFYAGYLLCDAIESTKSRA